MSEPTLLLVDGTALAYRAFYAIASLSTRDGRPTNAVFGFIRLLRQLEKAWRPGQWAVVFDGGRPVARTRVLPAYKEQRKPMPEALRDQFAPIEEYLERAGVCCVRLPGEEADDVMATLAERGAEGGQSVLLATSDKDMFQLVNSHVNVVSPTKVGARLGPEQIEARTGVPPALIVAWQALTGDAVDNIPGVPGVGEKTAVKLLGRYGSLEALWQHLDEVEPEKLRRTLDESRGVVERNVGLMTLRRDLVCGVDAASLAVRPPDPGRLLPFLEKMEFHSLAQALREPGLPGLPENPSA